MRLRYTPVAKPSWRPAVLWFALCAASGSALAHELTAREPLPVMPIFAAEKPGDAPMAQHRLTVKFTDWSRARADQHGGLSFAAGVETQAIYGLVQELGLEFSPLIRIDEARLQDLRARAAARSGREQPDLLGMMIVEPADGSPQGLVKAGRHLQELNVVEYAWVGLTGLPPPSDISPRTANYAHFQRYHGPDPGIGARYAWSAGARGSGVRLSDCEYGWITTHEDLVDKTITFEPGQTVPTWVSTWEYDEHGTSVLGELVSAETNPYGCIGLVPSVDMYVYPEWSDEEGSRRVSAITSAMADSAEGDVVLLEMQTVTRPGGGYGPAELDPDVWTVVNTGTDAGVIVVGAAGNGNEDLDSDWYETNYLSWGDSGAILVGAGSANTDHDKLAFSTYGDRVNLQGWGQFVFTLGYGDYIAVGGDEDQQYTDTFSGTSSASPIVTGAVVAVQSWALSNLGTTLGPDEMRTLLVDTGVAQGSGGHIGPLPDLEAAIDYLDTYGIPE